MQTLFRTPPGQMQSHTHINYFDTHGVFSFTMRWERMEDLSQTLNIWDDCTNCELFTGRVVSCETHAFVH